MRFARMRIEKEDGSARGRPLREEFVDGLRRHDTLFPSYPPRSMPVEGFIEGTVVKKEGSDGARMQLRLPEGGEIEILVYNAEDCEEGDQIAVIRHSALRTYYDILPSPSTQG